MAKVDLSVVVTVHNEGLIAHKTMRSVMAAIEKVEESGYQAEIVIHIDRGDAETIKYFERYEHKKNIRVIKSNFGDTGPSRNCAIAEAQGEYIAIIDGDDLISDNWLDRGMKMLKESEQEIVVHPEAVLTFGVVQPKVLTLQRDSGEYAEDILRMLGENCWCATVMAKKQTFLDTPYKKLGRGYGHEDYVFNIELIEKRILHKVAKGTVLFYRRSNNSRLSSGNRQHVVIPYVKAFDFEKFNTISASDKLTKKEKIKQAGYKFYKKIRNNDKLNIFITPVAKATIKILKYDGGKKVPNFVVEEWRKINRIETQLYPYNHAVKEVTFYTADEYLEVGKKYFEIARSVNEKPDYVFVVPWLVRGGADKVVINYIEALKKIHPEWRFAVITTLAAKNSWKDRLPEDTDFIDFGKIANGLVPEMRDKLFALTITQLKPRAIHIVNSEYGYVFAREHLELMKYNYSLFVSLFCGEYIPGSKMQGVFSYDDPYLVDIYGSVKKVFTDNKTIIEKTVEHNGFDREKFVVHYQPVQDVKIVEPKSELVERGKLRVLWAGRIVPTKLPDLVAKIGKEVDAKKIKIDVYGEISGEVNKKIFDGIEAIEYKGGFNGFNTIPLEKYDALLYTSLDDGIPNVILEAIAAGLAVVASNDGGVGELIVNDKTGILIEDFLDPKKYTEALEQLRKSPEKLSEYARAAQKLLMEQHNFEKFVKVVKNDITI